MKPVAEYRRSLRVADQPMPVGEHRAHRRIARIRRGDRLEPPDDLAGVAFGREIPVVDEVGHEVEREPDLLDLLRGRNGIRRQAEYTPPGPDAARFLVTGVVALVVAEIALLRGALRGIVDAVV